LFSEEKSMARKTTHTGGAVGASEDVSAAVQSLTEVAQSLATSASQMMQMLQMMQQLMQGRAQGAGPTTVPAATAAQINTWEDDPYSEATPTDDPPLATPIKVAVPVNPAPLLQFRITTPGPPPSLYAPETGEFRYWTAMEALTRGITFWDARLLPGTRWTTVQSPMQVTLEAGEDLNANYSRQFGLRFYHEAVNGIDIFSGESPDVSCHELGHAILDALRPELFDAASTEVAAFHESFGDMSAILSALQFPSLRDKVIEETGGRLNVNSRLSRLAEQLGWAIRQLSPTAVDPDCLRNAANRFFYEDPDGLPPSAPASQLASEPHSFSRVFTGAFLDALARMLTTLGPATSDNLLTVSRDLGQLLVDGVHVAPITTGYYSQVAAAMVQADQARFNGRYRAALTSGFVQHGILAPSAAAGLAHAPVPRLVPAAAFTSTPGAATAAFGGGQSGPPMRLSLGQESEGYRSTAQDAPALPTRTVTTRFGLELEVHAALEQPRFNVASAAAPTRGTEDEAHAFVEDLIQLGRIDAEPTAFAMGKELIPPSGRSQSKKTHTLVETREGKLLLKRLHFNCRCSRHR
jgi:hypothetical protein